MQEQHRVLYLRRDSSAHHLAEVLGAVELAATLGHRVEVTLERDATLRLAVAHTLEPLKGCPEVKGYATRDPRTTLCFHGGDEDGHPMEPVA